MSDCADSEQKCEKSAKTWKIFKCPSEEKNWIKRARRRERKNHKNNFNWPSNSEKLLWGHKLVTQRLSRQYPTLHSRPFAEEELSPCRPFKEFREFTTPNHDECLFSSLMWVPVDPPLSHLLHSSLSSWVIRETIIIIIMLLNSTRESSLGSFEFQKKNFTVQLLYKILCSALCISHIFFLSRTCSWYFIFIFTYPI